MQTERETASWVPDSERRASRSIRDSCRLRAGDGGNGSDARTRPCLLRDRDSRQLRGPHTCTCTEAWPGTLRAGAWSRKSIKGKFPVGVVVGDWEVIHSSPRASPRAGPRAGPRA